MPDAQSPVPCFTCPACVRMATRMHRDLFFLDGRQGSIKIDEVRVLKGILGEPPREAGTRVVIFCEAQALGEAAANSLLKSFEEPAPATSFLLLAPQRERLLPTLVSRSFALTLPWPLREDAKERERLAPWEAALCSFLLTGRDFFEKSGTRGAVDAPLVYAIIALCRRALCACLLQKADRYAQASGEGLESIFARLPEARLRMLDEALAECQDSLIYSVNPTLVLEWLASRLFLLIPRKR
ncbi:DNA polymerase III subunit delta' [Desulfovibrio sp. OttesenSCG-928-G15]|nr:DNA polymerase III subunit delta' [Desulfovibrio sp. OttesenSCG-928-G15]